MLFFVIKNYLQFFPIPMNQKLVSVIIPTYNRAYSVVEAIQSVKNQSYTPIQIIVVDDGSQDDTAEKVVQFEDIEYYYQENAGQAAARNLGLHHAKGKYIASLDSDDMWYTEFLTESVKCLEKYDLDFVFLNWISLDGKENFLDIWEQNKKWRKFLTKHDAGWFFLDHEQLRRIFLKACPSPSSSILLRRSSINSSWNEEMLSADDWFLMLEMVISKPCRAAFNLSPYWVKRVFGDNIYDGRDELEVTCNCLHDDRLMAQYLDSKLTMSEKYILRRRMAIQYLNFGRLTWKCENISKNVLINVAKAFSLAPVGISFYIMEIFINHVKYHIKTLSSHTK